MWILGSWLRSVVVCISLMGAQVLVIREFAVIAIFSVTMSALVSLSLFSALTFIFYPWYLLENEDIEQYKPNPDGK